jgi:starch phosphorylase
LDGWWAEAYSAEVGWTFGEGRARSDPAQQTAEESDSLYALLENDVVPSFYVRGENGLPREWLARVRRSMERLTSRFSASRMVREYVDGIYLPAAAAYRRRRADDGALAADIVSWQRTVNAHWRDVRFESVKLEPVVNGLGIEVAVHFGGLDPAAVRVQLFASPVDVEPPECVELGAGTPVPDAPGTFVFRAYHATMWPAEHYTARIVPYHPEARVPLELRRILWHR